MANKGLAFSLLVGFGLAITAQPSLAQTPGSAELLLRNPDEGDALNNLFNNRGDGSTSGLFELMQRISNPAVDPVTFRAQQRENLDAATAEFFKKQNQLLQQKQPQAVPPATVPTRQP